MVAWNEEEAGYYLSTYKQFENKPPDLIKERVDKSYDAMLRTALTSISKVNKTDVETLRTSFGVSADNVPCKPPVSLLNHLTEFRRDLPGILRAAAEPPGLWTGQGQAHTGRLQQALLQQQHQRAPREHTAASQRVSTVFCKFQGTGIRS